MGPGGGASKRSVLGAVTRKGRTSKNRVLNIGSVAGGSASGENEVGGFWDVAGLWRLQLRGTGLARAVS